MEDIFYGIHEDEMDGNRMKRQETYDGSGNVMSQLIILLRAALSILDFIHGYYDGRED